MWDVCAFWKPGPLGVRKKSNTKNKKQKNTQKNWANNERARTLLITVYVLELVSKTGNVRVPLKALGCELDMPLIFTWILIMDRWENATSKECGSLHTWHVQLSRTAGSGRSVPETNNSESKHCLVSTRSMLPDHFTLLQCSLHEHVLPGNYYHGDVTLLHHPWE